MSRLLTIAFLPVLLLSPRATTQAAEPPVATFSIVGFDPATGELGVAVESKFLGVGAVVPWAKAGVGAIATQAWANTSYGPLGLEMLASGESAQEVVDALTSADPGKARRQVGIVDASGNAATFTGEKCTKWAGGITGKNFCVQGNILAGEAVVKAMAETFVQAKGDLGDRLIAALAAGQKAGGDRRGRQSAALLIVKEGGGYGGYNDRYRDVRVDDHPTPIAELARIYALHKQTFRPRGNRRARRDYANLNKVKSDLMALKSAATRFRLRTNQWPDKLEKLVEKDANGFRYIDSEGVPSDPWGTLYKLDLRNQKLLILSAGPDREFDTEDDITTDNMTRIGRRRARDARNPTATLNSIKLDLAALKSAAMRFRLRMNQWPEKLEQLVTKDENGYRYMDLDKVPADPWGHPYKLEPGEGRIVIRSAGADGEYDTEDDITTDNMFGLKTLPGRRR